MQGKQAAHRSCSADVASSGFLSSRMRMKRGKRNAMPFVSWTCTRTRKIPNRGNSRSQCLDHSITNSVTLFKVGQALDTLQQSRGKRNGNDQTQDYVDSIQHSPTLPLPNDLEQPTARARAIQTTHIGISCIIRGTTFLVVQNFIVSRFMNIN